MRVVMVNDCAHVGYELRRELIKRGFKVEHVFFNSKRMPKVETLRIALRLRLVDCNLIHAHYCRSPAYASYFSGKPYIVHCHGSDIRGRVNLLKRLCLKKAVKVLVSTPDLLEVLPDAIWLPNPIDMERFRQLKRHEGNKVLYFPSWYENLELRLRRICERLSYELTVQPRTIPYENMHLFLNDFDIFIDRWSIKSYSKTALEAMACGLPVVSYKHNLEEMLEKLTSLEERQKLVVWQNRWILPQHNVKNVVTKLVNIYRDVYKT
ncbi:hypothetical protein KEJ27_10330 [Candidatus Bathyarchaeota archaeon]|nr:hypothetical protein [Candidatus Bathyarchaeota archaeon]